MGIRIEIEGADVEAVHASMRSLLPAVQASLDAFTLQELVAIVEKRAAAESVDLTITMPGDRKSPAEQRKAEARAKLKGELEESLKQAEPEKEPEKEPVKAKGKKAKTGNGHAENDEDRKARLVSKLQELFAGGQKAAVMKILNDHGGGAKTFSAIPADQFGPIDEAVTALS